MPDLANWDSFYVIVGSAGGALIGLQFVVMTLIADRPPKGVAEAGPAFTTPTVVHFGVVLFLSALVRVPWDSVIAGSIAWGTVGLGGLIYSGLVGIRMRTQAVYTPVFEDWLFHLLLPAAAYLALSASAMAAPTHLHGALFGVAAAALMLLFVSIHNAWDAVAYHVTANLAGRKRSRKQP